MKKTILYVPAIIYTVGIVALNIILKTFSPLWYMWAILLWAGGLIMSRGKCWGSILGLVPAIHLMYMSTQSTGQVINIEFPLGIVTAVYMLACGFGVWSKIHKHPTKNDVQAQDQ